MRAYGPYGGAGYGYAYNPNSGTYARGAAAYGPYGAGGWTHAYNPRTNTHRKSVRGTDYYNTWGGSVVRRDDNWLATANVRNEKGGVRGLKTSDGKTGFIGYDDNNLYAGKDGQVYRRNADGWQQRGEDGGWQDTDMPIENRKQADKGQRLNDIQSTDNLSREQVQQIKSDRAQRERSGTPSGSGVDSRRNSDIDRSNLQRQLNDDYRKRQQGNQRLDYRRSNVNRNYGGHRANFSGGFGGRAGRR